MKNKKLSLDDARKLINALTDASFASAIRPYNHELTRAVESADDRLMEALGFVYDQDAPHGGGWVRK